MKPKLNVLSIKGYPKNSRCNLKTEYISQFIAAMFRSPLYAFPVIKLYELREWIKWFLSNK